MEICDIWDMEYVGIFPKTGFRGLGFRELEI